MAVTPMMQRYMEIKARHKDCIVFYRLGDFYEMFFDDAEVVSKAIGLTLTGRDCGLDKRAPMCGVPAHASSIYVKKLVDKGFKVAICEQLTAPQKGKTLIDRDVVKIVTAGTVTEESFLDERKNNFIAAVFRDDKGGSVSWCDVTTGQFYSILADNENFDDILVMIAPKEIIDNSGYYGYSFAPFSAYETILRYFKIMDTKIFDFTKDSKIVNSAGALLDYLLLTQKMTLPNIDRINVVKSADFMFLDKTAREHLEILHTYHDQNTKKGSLLWVMDETETPMGARLLSSWISRPLVEKKKIEERLDAVETLVNDGVTCHELKKILSRTSDIGRLAGKAANKTIMPRDLLALAKTLDLISDIKKCLEPFKNGLLASARDGLTPLPELAAYISRAVVETPPAAIADGGYIKDGFNVKLDGYRNAGSMGRSWLGRLETKEREECKLKELKISYNRVTGYYFEIPLRLSSQVPYRFTRRGSTANTERYITEELKELEAKITGAQERAADMEAKILDEIRSAVVEKLSCLQKDAELVSVIDAVRSFATAAVLNKWTRPKINTTGRYLLKNARHPVVERLIGANKFIANDCCLTRNADSTMIITGPNMAGKSTYMKTVALNVLMAHSGSFVPCDSADIALTDRIFTRIGASDDMLTGQSTFMVEMNEVSNIVNNATSQSLLLLDEIGRGTGTADGLALAKAIIVYITNKIGCATMFATHFHELTSLAETMLSVHNYKVLVQQVGGEIVFLHKLAPGAEQNSFGIDVAKLSGLPDEILSDARKNIEKMKK